MKKNVFTIIRTSLFIIFLIIAFVFSVPAHDRLTNLANSKIEGFKSYLGKYELSVEYKSLSPSILSNFNINEIELVDSNNHHIMHIDRAKINYSIVNILNENFQKGITNIIVDGVELQLNDILDLIKKMKIESEGSENSASKADSVDFDISRIRSIIPENIKVKNVNVEYEENRFNSSIDFKEIVINNNLKKPYLGVQAEAGVKGKLAQYKKTLTAGITLNGILLDKIDDSYGQLKIHDITDGEIKVNKINLMLSYVADKLNAQTIQVNNPINLNADYDFTNRTFVADVYTENLAPVTLANFTLDKRLKNQLKNFLVTTKVNVKVADKKVMYDLSGNVDIPYIVLDKETFGQKITSNFNKLAGPMLEGGIQVAFDVNGNTDRINIKKLNVRGEKCNAKLNLNAEFATLKVDGKLEELEVLLPNGNAVTADFDFIPHKSENGFEVKTDIFSVGAKALVNLNIDINKKNSVYSLLLSAQDKSHEIIDNDIGTISFKLLYDQKDFQKKKLKSNLYFTSMYLDSILEFVAEASNEDFALKVYENKQKLENYVSRGDIEFESLLPDLKNNLSYELKNIALIDKNDAEHKQLFFNLYGNDESFYLENFSLFYGANESKNLETAQVMLGSGNSLLRLKNAVTATGTVFPGEIINYDLAIVVNSIPYNISGTYYDGVIGLSVNDYNLNFSLSVAKDNIFGGIAFKSMPVRIGNRTFIISLSKSNSSSYFEFSGEEILDFSYSKKTGPKINDLCLEFELEDPDVSVNPRIVLVGTIDNYTARFTDVLYSDLYATLEGYSNVEIAFLDDILTSINVLMAVENSSYSSEKINLTLSANNIGNEKLSLKTIKDDLSVDANISVQKLSLDRFTSIKSSRNYISGELTATGTINDPRVTVAVTDFSMQMASSVMDGNGALTLEDKNLSLNINSLNYSSLQVSGVTADFSLAKMEGNLFGDINATFLGKTINLPLEVNVSNISTDKDNKSFIKRMIPTQMNVIVASKALTGTFIKKEFGFSLSAMYNTDSLTVISSENLGLFGTYDIKSGELAASLNSIDNLSFTAAGVINENQTDIRISNLKGNAANIFSYMDFDKYFIISEGIAHGDVRISRSLKDPDFSGNVTVDVAEVVLPLVVPYKITASNVKGLIHNNQLDILDSIYYVKNSKKAKMNFFIYMNKWKLDHIDGFIKSEGKDRIPAKIDMGYFLATGDVGVDLSLFYEIGYFELNGLVHTDKVKLASSVNKVTSYEMGKVKLYKKFNVDVMLDSHASFDFDPLLRCIFVPNSKIHVDVDQRTAWYSIDGTVKIKSGDISYLNRNFFIKSGALQFVPGDLRDTRLTVSAETRERDSRNQNVRIIMDIEDQKILEEKTDFETRDTFTTENANTEKKGRKKKKNSKNVETEEKQESKSKYEIAIEPKFSSIPMKSENEIIQMLGGIVIADVNVSKNVAGSLAGTAGDYYVQSTVGRKIENTLREGLNFDIFSVRTNVIQNFVSEVSGDEMKASNLLDNSTVYIGKYLGDSIYLDGMLQVSSDDFGFNSLKWKPEIGLELELPVLDFNGIKSTGAIRGAFSGTLGNNDSEKKGIKGLEAEFVPSITFSWKISF